MVNVNFSPDGPVFPPPEGRQSNWIDPEDQTTFIITSHAICLVFVTVFVVLRLYTKVFIARKISLDDCCCAISYLLSIAFSTCQLTAEANGLGHHVWDIRNKDFPKAYQPYAIGIFVYIALQLFVKLTCLLFCRHIFHSDRKTLLFVNAGIAFVSAAYISISIVTLFQCQPAPYTWGKAVDGGRCFDGRPMLYFSAAVNVFSDIYILLVPIPAVVALPLGTAYKVRILSVFGLGIFACAMSIVRLGMVTSGASIDFTWDVTRVGIWSILEVDVGLICACLFVLPVFLKHYRECIPSWLVRLGGTSLVSHQSETKLTEYLGSSLTRSEGVLPGSSTGSLDLEMANGGSTALATDGDEVVRYNVTLPLTYGEGVKGENG